MATKRPYTKAYLKLDIFSTPAQKLVLAEALSAGKKVEIVQSSFTDPGPDYCSITVNDVCVVRVNGY
jgi:hypothetical protein